MIKIILISLFFLIVNCSKPKAVFICGDHVCINKTEAEQYFEENMTIQVQLINKKENSDIDLVELNLRHNEDNKKEITLLKKSAKSEIRSLSNDEIKRKKKELKDKRKKKKIVRKFEKDKVIEKKKEVKIKDIKNNENIKKKQRKKDLVDVCTFVEKCSIEEISKFLIEQGVNKDYPNLTLRN
tara:strand:+ start:3889 stop:4437 length:549 start_codon:yes stop_codon:yes gene_type:complete